MMTRKQTQKELADLRYKLKNDGYDAHYEEALMYAIHYIEEYDYLFKALKKRLGITKKFEEED